MDTSERRQVLVPGGQEKVRRDPRSWSGGVGERPRGINSTPATAWVGIWVHVFALFSHVRVRASMCVCACTCGCTRVRTCVRACVGAGCGVRTRVCAQARVQCVRAHSECIRARMPAYCVRCGRGRVCGRVCARACVQCVCVCAYSGCIRARMPVYCAQCAHGRVCARACARACVCTGVCAGACACVRISVTRIVVAAATLLPSTTGLHFLIFNF